MEHFLPKESIDHLYWDVYKEALATLERKSFPATGDSIERRAFEVLQSKYNDDHIRALMCFRCGRIVLDTGSVRTQIEYKHGSWLYSLPKRTLEVNFSFARYTRRYRKPGTPLAPSGNMKECDIKTQTSMIGCCR